MRLKQIFLMSISCILLATLSGCIFIVAGSVGAVGGYAITRDTIQGEYDANYSRAWKSALEVSGILGRVVTKNTTKGVIDAEVDKAKIKIEITQLTPEAIRLKVKARKGIFPRLGTAEKVFVKIVQQLMD